MRRNFAKKKEVIEMLNNGWKIFTDRKEFEGRKGQTIYRSLTYIISPPPPKEGDRNVHHSTIQGLIKKKIIYGPGENKYQLINKI